MPAAIRIVENKMRSKWAGVPRLDSTTVIVTGGNTGIGLATVKALAGKGAEVVLACRNIQKGRDALARIGNEIADARVSVEPLDLASMASIRAFAERIPGRYKKLDILINNAGVATPPLGYTEDGFETQFGTNFLGAFALTAGLLPLLLSSPKSRVISLSSLAHWYGRIDFSNLNAERGYSPSGAYGQSKLANLIYAYELQRRLVRHGANTISVAAHPGMTYSDLFRYDKKMDFVMGKLAQSVEQGATPSLMAATDPGLLGGEYVGPSGFLTLKGVPTIQKSSKRSRDEKLAQKLWNYAEERTGMRCLSA